MTDLYDLLERIKHKPGLYIGHASVSNLFMFLCGYKYSRRDLGILVSEQEQEFHEFQPWLQKRFNVNTSASWAQIILLFTGEESRAFITFFDLLEEFRTYGYRYEAYAEGLDASEQGVLEGNASPSATVS
ncbi:MAG: hypothetical protein HC769_12940 [Cyanobacteria bacterium CRU_2_1]|nr:hypothetical protein [Cyanobacteria bacterium CRU_2_1]